MGRYSTGPGNLNDLLLLKILNLVRYYFEVLNLVLNLADTAVPIATTNLVGSTLSIVLNLVRAGNLADTAGYTRVRAPTCITIRRIRP
eukprot:SAG31_NODE_823_length_11772_cov_10.262229_4_plen_88_part_00